MFILPYCNKKLVKLTITIYWIALIAIKHSLESAFDLSFYSVAGYHQMINSDDINLPYFSLIFINNQPPVWNLIYKISFDLFSSDILIYYLNILSSYISVFFVIEVLKRHSIGNILPYALGAIYILLPEVILYQMWGYSSQFTMMLILWNLFLFTKLYKEEICIKNIVMWSISFALISLTRQTYNFSFIIIIIYFFSRFALNIQRNLVIASIAIAVLPAISWQTKNYYLFDSFSMSTWAPRNVFRMTSIRLTPLELVRLAENNCSNLILLDPFLDASNYAKRADVIPYLDKYENGIKFWPWGNAGANSHVYLITSRLYGHEAVCIFRNQPLGYIKSLVQSWALYFTPVSDYGFIKQHSPILNFLDQQINRFFYIQLESDKPGVKSFAARALSRSIVSIIIYILLIFLLINFILKKKSSNLIILTYGATFVFINSLSNFFDAGENMRFRYDVNGVFYISFIVFFNLLLKRFMNYFRLIKI